MILWKELFQLTFLELDAEDRKELMKTIGSEWSSLPVKEKQAFNRKAPELNSKSNSDLSKDERVQKSKKLWKILQNTVSKMWNVQVKLCMLLLLEQQCWVIIHSCNFQNLKCIFVYFSTSFSFYPFEYVRRMSYVFLAIILLECLFQKKEIPRYHAPKRVPYFWRAIPVSLG